MVRNPLFWSGLVLGWLAPMAGQFATALCIDTSVPCDLGAPGDFDEDGDVDSADMAAFAACRTRAGVAQANPNCLPADFDGDTDVDPNDFGTMQLLYTGPCDCGAYLKEPPRRVPAEPIPDTPEGRMADQNGARTLYGFSGEFYLEEEDLRIKGRGMDFVWARKYRSRIGPDTAMGKGWDFSYNIRLEAAGVHRRIYDGNARSDVYYARPDGTWARREMFRLLSRNLDQTYTLLFADKGKWNFKALDGSPAAGKIASIVDRNGNTIAFSYDGLGRLVTIHDTLDTPAHNRDITIAYNPDGRIVSVTDYTGRQVTYTYYTDAQIGGSDGDLKSVTTPAVTGTPQGNDFPAGKTTVYTYSEGLADEQLNHNLLTITDPKAQTFLTNTYAATINPADLDFDRLTRQIWGDPGDTIDLVYTVQAPAPANNFARVLLTVNDRMGNVSEYFYDALNRLVIQREHTGRADPDLPTDLGLALNPPVSPLRPGDPAFFETRYEHNIDSLCTRILHPSLNEDRYTYDSSNASPRSRGNRLQHLQLPGPLGGDQAQIVENFQYTPAINNDTNFVTLHHDGRGGMTQHTYDANGNRLHTQHRIGSIVEDFEYNAFGQLTAHILPDNGSSHRRRDEYTYYASGPMLGYLEKERVDAPGLALTTTYEYDSLGRVTRKIDPRGFDTLYTYNQLDQIVRELTPEVVLGGGVRYERLTSYDANDNISLVDAENRDDQGAVQANTHFTTSFEYDILNVVVREIREVSAIKNVTIEYEYDANRNRTLVRSPEAASGAQPLATVTMLYDERDLKFQEIQASGSADQSTTQFDYDANGNVLRTEQGIEDPGRVTTYTHDGYNRETSATDPMGNVITYHYDANDNRTSERADGEPFDVVGDAGNIRLQEVTYTYDSMDRMIRQDIAHFDAATQTPIGDGFGTTLTFFNDNSQIIRVVDDNSHETLTTYDTANRELTVTDAKLNTVTHSYDANSNRIARLEVDKSDLGGPDQSFTTTYAYDGLDRLIREIDNSGNEVEHAYDSRSNRTRSEDARRPLPADPGNVTVHAYDGLNRLISTTRSLTADGTGTGAPAGAITTQQVWDGNSRLVQQIDASNNSTFYAYDALDRRVAVQHADTTVEQNVYDVHHNRVNRTDANGNLTHTTYDTLNRPMQVTVTVGLGVCTSNSPEAYSYDGLSRLVYAEDDDSLVTREYDSMGNLTRETQMLLPGGVPYTVTSTYDGVGNKLTCSYPSTRVITVAYDALDRKQTISDAGGTIATYAYVGPDRTERREYGNGTRTDYAHDGITGIPNAPGDFGVKQTVATHHTRISDGMVIDSRTYAWDQMGNKTQRKDIRVGGPALTHNYSYDSIYRLKHTTVLDSLLVATRDTDYSLDGVGNRAFVGGPGTPNPGPYMMSPSFPIPADRQMNRYTSTPADGRTYDRNGNLAGTTTPPPVPMPRTALRYDYRNQLCEWTNLAVPPGTFTTYRYDALGRRIEKAVATGGPPVITRYIYDGLQIIEERNEVGFTAATFVYGRYIDEVLHMQRGALDRYYHTDDLYNVMAVSGPTGLVVERYEYQDYGAVSFFSPGGVPLAATAIGNYFLFTGRQYDADTGFYHYRTRYFDPVAGRFLTRDVIGAWGDPIALGNAYTYVGNNPASRVDPLGLGWFKKAKKKLSKAFKKAKEGVKKFAEKLKEGTKKIIKDTKETLKRAGESLRTVTHNFSQKAKAVLKMAWESGIKGAITGAITGLILGGPAGMIAGAATGFIEGAKAGLKQGIMEHFLGIKPGESGLVGVAAAKI